MMRLLALLVTFSVVGAPGWAKGGDDDRGAESSEEPKVATEKAEAGTDGRHLSMLQLAFGRRKAVAEGGGTTRYAISETMFAFNVGIGRLPIGFGAMTSFQSLKPDGPADAYEARMIVAALEVLAAWPKLGRLLPTYRAGYVAWSSGKVEGSGSTGGGSYEFEADIETRGAYVRLGTLFRIAGPLTASIEAEKSFAKIRTRRARFTFREQESDLQETAFQPFGGTALLAGMAIAFGGRTR